LRLRLPQRRTHKTLRRDDSCAIYDTEGKTVSMGDHMPVHL
jgi:N-methylhydantoinase B/oxoprolinase/acetone carboxylase alpha subunit